MKSAIKAVNSSLSLILTIFELFVSIAFLAKLFGSGPDSEGGLFLYILEIMEMLDDGSVFFVDSLDLAGPVSFLVTVLGFMFFSLALFKIVPYMLRRQEEEDD